MRTWMLAEPIVIITSWYTEIKLLASTYTVMNVNFFLTKNMGKRWLKKCKPFLWELTLPEPSVCMGQWWRGSLGRPTSWKTWSVCWGDNEEWPPLTRRQLLSRVLGLEDWEAGRREGMMTRWMEQPGQRLSTDPSGLLLKRSPELWDLLVYCSGSWDCQKIRWRGKLSSLCYGQQGKNQLWLQMESSFASDRLCCPGEVISPLWDSVVMPTPRTIHCITQ